MSKEEQLITRAVTWSAEDRNSLWTSSGQVCHDWLREITQYTEGASYSFLSPSFSHSYLSLATQTDIKKN